MPNKSIQKSCEYCKNIFFTKRRSTRFCSPRCYFDIESKRRWGDNILTKKEKKKIWRRNWHIKNKERERMVGKIWINKNPIKMREFRARYYKKWSTTTHYKYFRVRTRAQRLKIPYEKDKSKFIKWFDEIKECFYCKIPLAIGKELGYKRFTQIDKMNPKKGYVVGNMAVSCHRCNLIKGYWFSSDEMTKIAIDYNLVSRPYQNSENGFIK